MADIMFVAYFLVTLIFFGEHSESLGVKKYHIADSKIEASGGLITIAEGTKFILTDDLHLKLEGDLQLNEKMDELFVYYHVQKKSMNFVKEGEIDVCEIMLEHGENSLYDCMFDLFGLSSRACPIEKIEINKDGYCDLTEAKDKMEMAKGVTTFEYILAVGDQETTIKGFMDIESK